ncbi:MAG: PQQ-binding-like beta-propeller repeat protein [bacterium]|nr:PQQ-binding-like beta-propeller repeat protein [bacterium]
MKRILIPLTVLSLSLFAGASIAQPQTGSPWPMYRHDANHTGRSDEHEGPPSCGLSWSYNLNDFWTDSSPAVGSDGRVYIAHPFSRLYAFDSAGGPAWSFNTNLAAYGSPAIDEEGRVYIGSYDNRLRAVGSDGTLVWSYQTGDAIENSSPAIGSDGSVYIGSHDNTLYAFGSSGSLAWSYITDEDIDTSPAVLGNGAVCFTSGETGEANNAIHVLTNTGSLAWSYQTADSVGTPLYILGKVFAGSRDGRFHALDSSGLIWSYQTGTITTAPALGTGGHLYVGSQDMRLYAFTSAGALVWSYSTAGYIHHSSPAIGSGGAVYFGSQDNALYALDSAGSLLWSYVTGGDVQSSPPITGDGRVLFTSRDNNLYCIGAEPAPTMTPTMTPAATPTPTVTPTPTIAPTATLPPVPQAEVLLNGTSFRQGDRFTASFRLNESVAQPFDAYAVVQLPDGSMLDALTLGTKIVPVATNVPGLDAPFTYPLMDLSVPGGAPAGNCRVMAGFFTPGQPVTKPEDAFLLATTPFRIVE